jgi:hypothetical protein
MRTVVFRRFVGTGGERVRKTEMTKMTVEYGRHRPRLSSPERQALTRRGADDWRRRRMETQGHIVDTIRNPMYNSALARAVHYYTLLDVATEAQQEPRPPRGFRTPATNLAGMVDLGKSAGFYFGEHGFWKEFVELILVINLLMRTCQNGDHLQKAPQCELCK